MKKRQKRAFLLSYTAIFILTAALVFCWFPERGRRMVWQGDGLSQHYVALCYYARWGRAVLRSILAGQPAFPTLNLHMGFGADLFTTLQYYVIGDPFSLPAVLVPQKYILTFHDAMILLRMYLAGLCFDGYCRTMGHRDLAANLCGALLYVFGSFVLFGMRHPYFINAMIWFPLLLTGAEHIFRGRKGRLFTLAVFLSCISNFYFFYMLVALTVLYAVWRALRRELFPVLFARRREGGSGESGQVRREGGSGESGQVRREGGSGESGQVRREGGSEEPGQVRPVRRGSGGGPDLPTGKTALTKEKEQSGACLAEAWKRVLLLAGRFVWRAGLGTALGACFLLPILLRFAQDPRASEGVAYSFLYPAAYYRGFLESFVAFGTATCLENWTCMGFGGIGLLGVLLLFFGGKTERGIGATGKAECGTAGTGKAEHAESGIAGDTKTERGPADHRAGVWTGHPDLKIAFVGMVLMVLLPAAGAALNGFTYPANRWIWAFSMLTGYIAAVMLPSLKEISAGRLAVILLLMAAFAAVCAALGGRQSTTAELVLAAAAAAAVRITAALGTGDPCGSVRTVCTAAAEGAGQGREQVRGWALRLSGRWVRSLTGLVLTGTVVLTAALHGYVCFHRSVRNSGVERYHTDAYIAAMMASDAAGMRALLGNEDFYRYSGRHISNNFNILNDVSDTQYYWSLSDGRVERFFTETGQSNGMVHLYDNLDNRTMLDEIAGVKYYKRGDGSLLPLGYDKREELHYDNRDLFREEDGKEEELPIFSFSVYENRYALPLGFTCGYYLDRQTWDGLTIPQRQEALMQGVLLEDPGLQELREWQEEQKDQEDPRTQEDRKAQKEQNAREGQPEGQNPAGQILRAEPVFVEREVPFVMDTADLSEDAGKPAVPAGIEILRRDGTGTQLIVRDTEAVLTLEAEQTEDLSEAEISLLLTGMDYAPLSDEDRDAYRAAAAKAGQAPAGSAAEEQHYSTTDPVSVRVIAGRGGHTVSDKEVNFTLADNPWKTGRSDFLSCCGYTEEPLEEIRLRFSRPGIYTFRELKIIRQPMELYPSQAERLGEHGMENLNLHELAGSGATDRITGTVETPKRRILCLQIPRLEGLRAFVDGEEVPLLQADIMFSAVLLEAGRHEVELRYRTPGLTAGAGISTLALLLLLAEAVCGAVRARRKREGSQCVDREAAD